MDSPLFILLIAATAVWVYWDATKNNIGKTASGGLFNLSAGAWGVCTLLLWIVAFPAYLFKRKSLMAIAGENPVTVNMRVLKASIIGLVGFVWFIVVAYSQYLAKFQ